MQMPALVQTVVCGFGRFHMSLLRTIGTRGPLAKSIWILAT